MPETVIEDKPDSWVELSVVVVFLVQVIEELPII